jgi:hypothetical protein
MKSKHPMHLFVQAMFFFFEGDLENAEKRIEENEKKISVVGNKGAEHSLELLIKELRKVINN